MKSKSLKKVLLLGLIFVFTFALATPTTLFAFDKSEINKPALAMQPSVENKELEKLSNKEGLIKLDENNPLIIEFEDGSKIQYELDITNSPMSGKKTYTVTKIYFVGFSSLTVKLHTEVTHSGRRVTIDRTYDTRNATFGKWSNTETSIIRKNGEGSTYAVSEAYGMYTYTILNLGDIYTGTSRIQAQIDSVGAAYLKVLK